MVTPTRWVVLGGLGSIGRVHAANLRTLGIEPLIVDPIGDQPTWDAQPLDAVVIASPSRFHEEQVEALKSQVLAILVEKPPALSGKVWRQLSMTHCRLAVGFNWRFHQAIPAFRDRPPDSLTLSAVDGLWTFRGGDHLFDKSQGGGIVLTSGVHSIDLACHIMGKPMSFEGSATDHTMHLVIQHANGASRISLEWTNAGKPFSHIGGWWYGVGEHSAPLTTPSPMHARMMREFANYASTGEPGHLCTAEQAQWVMDIADAF